MFGARLLVFLMSTAVWAAASHAAQPVAPKLEEELAKQDKIYHSQGQQTIEGYTVNRALDMYADGLPSDFDHALAVLGPKDRWLDVGAGEGQAVLDYYTSQYDATHPQWRDRRGTKAQAVAMSIEDRRTPRWTQTQERLGVNQIRYLYDKRLQDYTVEDLGRFQVITDVIGGFSYTRNMSLFIEKVLGFLEVNGTFYTVLQDVQDEAEKKTPHYKGSPFLTTIAGADGSDMKVCTWLKSISCVEVTCETKGHWTPPMEAFRIRKTCDQVSVPPLELTRYSAGTPPERRFVAKPQPTSVSAKAWTAEGLEKAD